MKNSVVKLKKVLGRDVSADEAEAVVDYLLACLTHVTNARPLFGVLNTDTDTLEWTAGGGDFNDIFQAKNSLGLDQNIASMDQLFGYLGISKPDLAYVQKHMKNLCGETASYLEEPMMGEQGRCFRVVMRRRVPPNANHIQFSILDITSFKDAARNAQHMSESLWADMALPMAGDKSAYKALLGVVDDLEVLFDLNSDKEIHALAVKMSDTVTQVSERMVALLKDFETNYDSRHWQPNDLTPSLGPAISVHTAPMTHWREQRCKVMDEFDGEPAVSGIDVFGLQQAYDFVQQAAVTFVISPTPGCIYILNGPKGGQRFGSVDDFVRGLEVEENSVHTALDFFEHLDEKPALGVFAIADQNQEAWGRPSLYKGWQAMLVPSTVRAVDVRGLFHGLKNLLLHLQVLYVVKDSSDVEQVKKDLRVTGQKIRHRLSDIENIALTGLRRVDLQHETVMQWFDTVKRLAKTINCKLNVSDHNLENIAYMSSPGEMEDTLEELVRNAAQHGASEVDVKAFTVFGYLNICIEDNGRGMTPQKLQQVRKVLKNHTYDKSLSTRKDGTGNGLLAAAKAVSNFVDGALHVRPRAQGQGVEIVISMKLPPSS